MSMTGIAGVADRGRGLVNVFHLLAFLPRTGHRLTAYRVELSQ
jgi:hypothetical protein